METTPQPQAQDSAVTDIHHSCKAFSLKGFHSVLIRLFDFQQEPCPGIQGWGDGLSSDAVAHSLGGVYVGSGLVRSSSRVSKKVPWLSLSSMRVLVVQISGLEKTFSFRLYTSQPCSVWLWESSGTADGKNCVYSIQSVLLLFFMGTEWHVSHREFCAWKLNGTMTIKVCSCLCTIWSGSADALMSLRNTLDWTWTWAWTCFL